MDTQTLMTLVIIISAIVVGVDAGRLGAGKHNLGGMAATSATVWALGTLLLWIIVLPMYLITRPKLVRAFKANPDFDAPASAGKQRRCAVCDKLYAAEYDACPHCAKAKA